MKRILYLLLIFSYYISSAQDAIGHKTAGIKVARVLNESLIGTGTRVGTVASTGVTQALANGTDGQVLQLVSGAPAWGAITSVAGTLVGVRFFSTGTSYTPTTGTTKIIAELVGGGGGGGGASGAASSVGAGGGGGSGSYLRTDVITVTNTAYTIAIGAAGTAGANTGGNGGAGGNTTLAIGATTYTANGGTGGTGQTAGTTAGLAAGGTGGAVSTNGLLNAGGDAGSMGVRLSGTVGVSGFGGSSKFGGGGGGLSAAGAGNNGVGFGAGGGGALSTANTNRAGGAGTVGGIWILEFR